MKCKVCNTETSNPKYCSRQCATSVINKTKIKEKPKCLFCEQELPEVDRKFCSNICQGKYRTKSVVDNWKNGEISGVDNTIGIVITAVKNYLREKYNDSCVLCGWSVVNPHTGKVPLIADHIDGNWKNNKEENLRLLCPNCDSLQPTYGGSNRGKGRTINGKIRHR